ncbi:hypothetical protein [Streptomyces abyssomicinicus]|uniref:hypothetical protein n=1 Tax=Streptomyces abyssomicinicus TaxID=574929 RepID=UPI00124FCC14|nr:hypothetical protein [Streptomyces abyssomicinicus]
MSRRRTLALRPIVTEDEELFDAEEDQEPGTYVLSTRGGQDADNGVVAELTGADVSSPLTVAHIPAPYAAGTGATLDDKERAHLATCERAVAGLQRAFAIAGKALATINQARLYRETHATFTDYLTDRWKMSESQAYRLMDAWPVYAQLESAGVTVLNERQARELVASFRKHGGPATVALVKAVEKHTEKPTAATYAAARKALPSQLPNDPHQLERTVEEATVRALPRQTSPIGGETATAPSTRQAADEGGVTPEEVDAGAEAMAKLEAAVAQQRQVYAEIPPDILAAAMLYDPGRAERLRHEGAQYATRAGFRFRGTAEDEDE